MVNAQEKINHFIREHGQPQSKEECIGYGQQLLIADLSGEGKEMCSNAVGAGSISDGICIVLYCGS